jgi:hypothetical protein
LERHRGDAEPQVLSSGAQLTQAGRDGDAFRLATAIESLHPDPFHAIPRDELFREAARVDALPIADRDVRAVELMRLTARLGPRNGHTTIDPLGPHPTALNGYPLWLYEFDDGVFVVDDQSGDLIGGELIAINGVGIDEVRRAVTPLIAHDNNSTILARRPTFVVNALVLRGLGISSDPTVSFRFRSQAGSIEERALEPVRISDLLARLADAPLFERARQPYLRRRNEWRWTEPTDDGRAVHVGYNVTLGDLTTFAPEVEALAASSRVRFVVLDLRHNGGGDNRTYQPLLDALERLASKKRLAVLTSRATFSAAMQFVVDLEQNTDAVFVGEATGGSPNHYGNAVTVPLDELGLNASVATVAWTTAGASDQRLTRAPDIPVTQESTSFFGGDDPTFAAAVAAIS